MQTILLRLWPLLKVRVVALIATFLVDFSKRNGFPIEPAVAAEIAATVVQFIEGLIAGTMPVDEAMIAHAAAALRTSAANS